MGPGLRERGVVGGKLPAEVGDPELDADRLLSEVGVAGDPRWMALGGIWRGGSGVDDLGVSPVWLG